MFNHFLNCLKCNDHPEGGTRASCAVDSLIEIFHFCLYKNSPVIRSYTGSSSLITELLSVSQYQEQNKRVFCGLREPLWNFLVKALPHHFAPMGRGDAQTFAAFTMMISDLAELFQLVVYGDVYCMLCKTERYALPTHAEPLSLSRGCVLKGNKCFQQSVEIMIEIIISNHTRTNCHACQGQLSILNASLHMPKYLMVEVPVHNNANIVDIVIPQSSAIFGNTYQMIGVVMKQHGHFYVIIKQQRNNGFVLIDDMKNDTPLFPTLSAAVKRNKAETSQIHKVSLDTHAVWLVLLEHVSGSRQLPVQYGRTSDGRKLKAEVVTSLKRTTSTGGSAFKSLYPEPLQSQTSPLPAAPVTASRQLAAVSVNQKWTVLKSKQSQSIGTSLTTGASATVSTPSKGNASTGQGPNYGHKSPPHTTLPRSVPVSLPNMTSSGASVSQCTPTKGIVSNNIGSEGDPQTPLCTPVLARHTGTQQTPTKKALLKGQGTHHVHSVTSHTSLPTPGSSVVSKATWLAGASTSPGIATTSASFTSTVTNSPGASTTLSTPDQSRSRSFTCSSIQSPSGHWKVAYSPRTSTPIQSKPLWQSSPSGRWKVKDRGSKLTTICINDKDVPLTEKTDGKLYLMCRDLWQASGLEKSVTNRGYSRIDRLLAKEGMTKEAAFLFSGKIRTFVGLDAALIVCDKWKGTGSWKKENERKLKVTKESLTKLARERRAPRKMLRFIANTANAKDKNTGKISEKSKYKHPVRSLRKIIVSLFNQNFKGDRLALMKCLGGMFRASHQKKFCGYLSKKDVKDILSSVPPSKKNKTTAKNLLEEVAKETFQDSLKMSTEDLIDMVENFTGYRLAQQLKKRIPGIPGKTSHIAAQKLYRLQVDAVLLPRRTPTGYEISIARLIEVLQFRYYWLQIPIHWRVYGDGREICGKHSTFVAISPMNNEMVLNGEKFQSPKHVFHTNIFYESDSRYNMEENLGYPSSRLDREIHSLQEDGRHTFSLAADYMFLMAVLDGDNKLSPTSDTGWSIYKEVAKAQKGEVSSSGLRTDLRMEMDRDHPSSLLPSIPLQRIVFCLLHGIARSVEHLLTYVIEDISGESNRLKQQKSRTDDVDSYKMNKIQTLENNINKLGVRQGKFHFQFDQSGKLKQVKLNKDHAYTILSPNLNSVTDSHPPCLKNVLSESLIINNVKPPTVKKKLDLKDKYSVFELVCTIWSHFYQMVTILREDQRRLKTGSCPTSKDPNDYEWGYDASKLSQYRHHAESFYQLFTLRYPVSKLTPYMIILIDQAPVLMKTLPFPIARYTSESGEHKNYDDNRYIYQHTTRGGGHDRADTILALFRHTWKTLSHAIIEGTGQDGEAAADKFMKYVQEHVAALKIQRVYRGWLTRRKLTRHSKWTPTSIMKTLDGDMKEERLNKNQEVLNELGFMFRRKESLTHDKLFRNKIFVLCGNVPHTSAGRMKQEDMGKLITENGGRVKKSLPATQKGVSTKDFVVLSNDVYTGKEKKVHAPIKYAIAGGHAVLKYEFVLDSIKAKEMKDQCGYTLDVASIAATITKQVPLHKQYFCKSAGTFASIVKKQRRAASRNAVRNASSKKTSGGKRKFHAKSAAMFYALHQTRFMGAKSFKDQSQWMGFFMKKWTNLPAEEKAKFDSQWKESRNTGSYLNNTTQ